MASTQDAGAPIKDVANSTKDPLASDDYLRGPGDSVNHAAKTVSDQVSCQSQHAVVQASPRPHTVVFRSSLGPNVLQHASESSRRLRTQGLPLRMHISGRLTSAWGQGQTTSTGALLISVSALP